MSNRLICVVACIVGAGAVGAQSAPAAAHRPVLGKAANVQGLVTVSDDQGVSRVLVNNSVIDRSRYVTSSSGSVTLRMDKGCDIVLKPNQALTVESAKSCEGWWASIESLGQPAGANLLADGGAGLVAGGGAGVLIPFVAGGAAILLMDGGASATPAGGGGGNGGGGGSGGGNAGGGGGGGQTLGCPPVCVSPE